MATPEQPARAARTLDDLFRRHAADVYRYTYAVLGNRADAEDVTQATFVNALRALERGEQPRKPANWLLAIAHNLMRQRFRQERARPVQVALEADLPQIARSSDETPSVGELVSALGRIPESQREAIVMREFEGRSYAEIGEILGVTTSALETLLFRARRSLAEELANVVTCARAEQDVSLLLDGRLSRKERKRLQEHVRTCPACARFEALQHKQRRALKALALLPLPASFTLFRGAHSAAAAAGLPTIGTAATGSAAAAGGTTFGGVALAGVAAKAAVVVAAIAVAGGVGVGYEGATHVHLRSHQPATARTKHVSPRTARTVGVTGNAPVTTSRGHQPVTTVHAGGPGSPATRAGDTPPVSTGSSGEAPSTNGVASADAASGSANNPTTAGGGPVVPSPAPSSGSTGTGPAPQAHVKTAPPGQTTAVTHKKSPAKPTPPGPADKTTGSEQPKATGKSTDTGVAQGPNAPASTDTTTSTEPAAPATPAAVAPTGGADQAAVNGNANGNANASGPANGNGNANADGSTNGNGKSKNATSTAGP